MAKELTICSPQLGVSPQSNLGGEVYDREIIKSFCQLGIKVIIILPKNKPYLARKNLKVYFLPFPFIWPPYLFNFFIVPYLLWLYKKEKFNILRIHSPYFVGLGALVFKLLNRSVPLVATYHHLEEKKPFFDLINRLIIKKWNLIVTDSKFSKKEIIEKYKVKSEKIHIVYPGIEKKFKPLPRKSELIKKYKLKKRKVLLFLGRLEPRKNIAFILQFIRRINDPNLKLLICGKGSLYQDLINKAEKLKVKDKVIFTGFIPEEEKVDYYNLADIFLFPSKKEGFGFSVVEAAACGVPSVVSEVSSLKEIVINGKTGYLAKLNDVDDWKQKIKRLLRDESLRKKMGQSARKFSQNFSWQKSAKKQIEIYNQSLTISH